jgi:type III secretory pathway component EscS
MGETLELTRQALWLVLMLSGPPILSLIHISEPTRRS